MIVTFLKKSWAFILKDLRNESSYKFAFVAQFAGILFTTLSFFFLSKLVSGTHSAHLAPYGGDYFSFVLIGIAFGSYLQVSLRSFSSCIRNAQVFGTLESLLVTQTNAPTIIIASTFYSFLLASYRIFIYLALGLLFLGFKLDGPNILGAFLFLCLTILCFSSFGIVAAGFIMVLKKGDPLSWAFTSLSWLLGGVYFPTTILPDWLRSVSYLLPITHSLEGMRLSLLQGIGMKGLLPNLIPLFVFVIVLMPMSLVIFKYALKKAKINGSLIQY
jgi:ABC-2 type transport system permease protein